ncbi:MAG TPA: hypothetical protein VEF04_13585, partial [Blastocatellia bacterium]|nr:hypothetical protein [Blastocatellia bacterium]
MGNKHHESQMICPCCGRESNLNKGECHSCGARQVGEPLAQPDNKLPGLGASFGALTIVLVIVLAFAFTWLLGNDFRVLRVLAVWGLGDANALSQYLLNLDPDLPYYRIFSYDAYKLAVIMSFGAVPLSLLG